MGRTLQGGRTQRRSLGRVERFDDSTNPTPDPTNVQVAARWLDVVQRMRDMIAPRFRRRSTTSSINYGSVAPTRDYNWGFAFSAFIMPLTYAIAATPPRGGSGVEAAIAPLTQAVQDVLADSDVRAAMSRLEDAMATAEEALKSLVGVPEPASVTELVEELKRTVKGSMLAALLGSSGIGKLADAEFNARLEELEYPPPQARWVELASEPVSVVSQPTDTTVSIEEVYQSAAPGVQGMLQVLDAGGGSVWQRRR